MDKQGAELPKPDLNVLAQWHKMQQEMKTLQQRESVLRAQVFSMFFTEGAYKPEGTNNYELPEHWLLKAVTSLNRKLDIEILKLIKDDLAERGVAANDLVKWEPKVNLEAYRSLNDEQRVFFDQCLEIKPGMVQLKIELPAKYKKDVVAPPTL